MEAPALPTALEARVNHCGRLGGRFGTVYTFFFLYLEGFLILFLLVFYSNNYAVMSLCDGISLRINDVEYLLMCFFAIFIASW